MKIKLIFIFLIFALVSIFFKDLILKGNLPIPADTIVGLYHPFRDLYAKDYPRGVPFKNFLITDPVRQQYPWKNLVIEAEKKLNIPLWNPYNFSGTPLLGNFQSGAFYPFNLLFFIFSFPIAWSLLIFSQPLLAGIFLFIYLDSLKLDKKASLLGAITFAFCGFSISWMEWGNIVSTALWLPLLLLSSDKIISLLENKKKLIIWSLVYLLSLLFSFLAGHLQIFFYVFIASIIYFLFNIVKLKEFRRTFPILIGIYSIFILITSIVWIPTLQFIILSARNLDQANWTQPGWFIPWQNLIQFLSPDFFGNPTTLNYFGIWNYGEFIGYIGIGSLILAIYAIFSRREKNTFFFSLILIFALIFSLPNFISALPYKLSIPFISASQPTRLLFLIDFALSVLAALGFDLLLKEKNLKKIILSIIPILTVFLVLWIFVLGNGFNTFKMEDLLVSKRNLMLPSALFFVASFLLLAIVLIGKKKTRSKYLGVVLFAFLLLLVVDLFRFGWKFLPFTDQKYLYPNTSTLNFLSKNLGNHRIMATDSTILPPNFSIMYKLQTVDGYDPLYLQRYAELAAAIGRGKPDISSPFGFNRIITPQNSNSPFINLLGVKYILSAEEINNQYLTKVYSEGRTNIYENIKVLGRAFFVQKTIVAKDKQDAINLLFSEYPFQDRAVIENASREKLSRLWEQGEVKIVSYAENKIVIETQNKGDGFLVLTDSFYPTWRATIDGKEIKIYLTDYNFRGIVVPKGEHKVIFYDTLF